MNILPVLFIYFVYGVFYSSARIDLDLARQLAKVQSTEEFLQNFVTKNGLPVRFNISSLQGNKDEGDKVVVSGEFEDEEMLLAGHDMCQPRMRTVVIPRDNDPSVIYWPTCTRVERCGGCCPTDELECLPVRTEMVTVHVLKTTVQWPASDLDFTGPVPVNIQRDLECEPQCRTQPNHCNPLQQYNEWSCSCDCIDTEGADNCGKRKVWDPNLCACVCRKRKRCKGIFEFSESTCKCEDRAVSGGSASLEDLIEILKKKADKEVIDKVLKAMNSGEDDDDDDHVEIEPGEHDLTLEVAEQEVHQTNSTAQLTGTSLNLTTEAATTESQTTELMTTTEPTTAVPTTVPTTTVDTRTDDEICAARGAPPCPPRFDRFIHANGRCGCKFGRLGRPRRPFH